MGKGFVVRERDASRLLTLERQFCVFCWESRGNVGTESYRAAQVISVAARRRYTKGNAAQREAAFRQYRRRMLTAHLRAEHPAVLDKLMQQAR